MDAAEKCLSDRLIQDILGAVYTAAVNSNGGWCIRWLTTLEKGV